MDRLQAFKEAVLREYPRLGNEDFIAFHCGPGVACFNRCCADVNIFLTPYDVLRLRLALRLGSSEFLARYVIIPFDKNQKLPVPLLRMNDTPRKECPFVSDQGCTVYYHRPWPCRMYPLGEASPGPELTPIAAPFYFVLHEDFCRGWDGAVPQSVSAWLEGQQVAPYEEFGELFKSITLHPRFQRGFNPTERQTDMYWMALYDLDRFRSFVLESSFLKRFELTSDEIAALPTDDEALLRLGFKLTQMALFGEESLKIRPEAIAAVKANSPAAGGTDA